MDKISKKNDIDKPFHIIKNIRFVNEEMKLWVDGKEYTFSLKKISSRLYNASKIERLAFRISSSGYGIHWPLIDEDLSIDGLLGIKHYPPTIKYEYPQQHLLAVKEKSSIYKSKRNK